MLTVTDAMGLAADLGLTTTVVVKPRTHRVDFSVAISSSDPSPTVSVRRGGHGHRASDMLLGERSQFGPDSWDYPASVSTVAEYYFLRLQNPDGAIDIPFLTPREVIVATRRWPMREEAIAGVARDTWDRAVAELRAGGTMGLATRSS